MPKINDETVGTRFWLKCATFYYGGILIALTQMFKTKTLNWLKYSFSG